MQYLREVRKHGGLMVPGPVQAAAVAAFDDQQHVDVQREIYRERLELGLALLRAAGADVELPGGGFYLWAAALAVMPGRSPNARRASRCDRQPERVLRPPCGPCPVRCRSVLR